jgi:hypothetical protein
MAKIINLGISNRKDSILELIFKGNSSNLEALLQNPNFSTPLLLIVWDTTAMNAIAASSTAMNAIAASSTAMNAVINSSTAMNAVINSSTAMNAIAASSTAMNAVINSQTALNAVKSNSTAWNTFINSTINVKEVPTMTSNTAPEGVASASSIYSSTTNAFKAFDKSTSTYWYAGGNAPQWIQYQFINPVFIHSVVISGYGSSGASNNPNSITIQASTDGSTFTDIQTINQEFTNSPTTLYIAKQGYYKYWRVKVNSTVSSSSNPAIIELNYKGFIQPT